MAKKKLNPEEEIAARRLRDRIVMTIQFIEDVQDFPSGVQMRAIAESAANSGDYRTLRLLAKEIDAMTIALATHERDGLEALLQTRLDVNKDAERAEERKNVAAVLRRGTIASEKERRRLEEYVDSLEATGGDPGEIEAVRHLLRVG
jgi:hypothetical protein